MKTHGTIEYAPPGENSRRGMWRLKADPHVMTKVKRIFPRVESRRSGAVYIFDSLEVARDLEWLTQRYALELVNGAAEALSAGAKAHRDREEAVASILAGRKDPLTGLIEPAREPREYQRTAADLALTTGRLLLADDLGLGKSFSGLMVLRHPEALPALVVCQTHLPTQWLRELEASFPMLTGHIAKGTKPYDITCDVLILSYSKLAGWADHLAGEMNTVIFDECQELRRAGSLKYVAASQIADGARFKMGLTATPVYNYGGEVYNIVKVLQEDALGTHYEFVREWGAETRNGHVQVENPGALGAYLRDEGLLLRRTRKEVGRELPEVVRVPHPVESDEEKVRELTEDAGALAALILDRETSKEDRWKASGQLDWKLRRATGVGKAPYVAAFVRMLLESGEQVVLFGWHRDVYDVWMDALAEFHPRLYTGTESPKQKDEAREAFLSGHSRVLIMSLRAGAGLDGLQDAAHVAVFGELDWSPGIHDQCIGRLHRDGQGESVIAYFLVSEQGSDPVVAEVLQLKRMQAEPIRDPDAELLEEAPDTSDRVRKLAEAFLEKRGAMPV